MNGVNSGGSTSYNVASGATAVTSSGGSSSSSTSSSGVRHGFLRTSKLLDNEATKIINVSPHRGGSINISSREGATLAIENITAAIDYVLAMRANIGAVENRLEHSINSLFKQSVNTRLAQGRILDANMAFESTRLVKSKILQEAGTFVLSEAYRNRSSVLGLIS